MENTEDLLFENDRAQFFVAKGSRWLGPFTAREIYRRIEDGEFQWVDYCWRMGKEKDNAPGEDWRRICEEKVFLSHLPSVPEASMLHEIREHLDRVYSKTVTATASAPPPPGKGERLEEVKNWFLYFNDGQFGPFSVSEIQRQLLVGKINPRVHAWKDGNAGWVRIESISELMPSESDMPTDRIFSTTLDLSSKGKKKVEKASNEKTSSRSIELRDTPRLPMVARIMIANESSVCVGICRDVSTGGMQVLTDQIPGKVGSSIKINVTPTAGSAFAPFVAEGTIVRILEDRRGFSFRFDQLGAEAKKSIVDYIKSAPATEA